MSRWNYYPKNPVSLEEMKQILIKIGKDMESDTDVDPEDVLLITRNLDKWRAMVPVSPNPLKMTPIEVSLNAIASDLSGYVTDFVEAKYNEVKDDHDINDLIDYQKIEEMITWLHAIPSDRFEMPTAEDFEELAKKYSEQAEYNLDCLRFDWDKSEWE